MEKKIKKLSRNQLKSIKGAKATCVVRTDSGQIRQLIKCPGSCNVIDNVAKCT
ncbi:bacteriocin-like protein [Elizabethkingia anophelis]|uniref:bacteriocin-like protein n=1 Tax=Elizabethkingia anophelis TaxID=1117645 RepID=UPI004058654B